MSTSVFISSTSVDLKPYRQAVMQACREAGYHPIGMEDFGAQPQDATTACLKEVAEADLFIGIYAWRYGHIPAGQSVSITEMEFDEATRLGKPRFCFFVEEAFDWDDKLIEGGRGAQLLARFKQKVDGVLVRATFTTPENLQAKVAASLARHGIDIQKRKGETTTGGAKININGNVSQSNIAGRDIHIEEMPKSAQRNIAIQRILQELADLELRRNRILHQQSHSRIASQVNRSSEAYILVGIVVLFIIGAMTAIHPLLGIVGFGGSVLFIFNWYSSKLENKQNLDTELNQVEVRIRHKQSELDGLEQD